MLTIMRDILLAAFSVVSALFLFFLLVGGGWYIVWKLFLSRFKLIRELLDSVNGVTPSEDEPKNKPGIKTRKLRRD